MIRLSALRCPAEYFDIDEPANTEAPIPEDVTSGFKGLKELFLHEGGWGWVIRRFNGGSFVRGDGENCVIPETDPAINVSVPGSVLRSNTVMFPSKDDPKGSVTIGEVVLSTGRGQNLSPRPCAMTTKDKEKEYVVNLVESPLPELMMSPVTVESLEAALTIRSISLPEDGCTLSAFLELLSPEEYPISVRSTACLSHIHIYPSIIEGPLVSIVNRLAADLNVTWEWTDFGDGIARKQGIYMVPTHGSRVVQHYTRETL